MSRAQVPQLKWLSGDLQSNPIDCDDITEASGGGNEWRDLWHLSLCDNETDRPQSMQFMQINFIVVSQGKVQDTFQERKSGREGARNKTELCNCAGNAQEMFWLEAFIHPSCLIQDNNQREAQQYLLINACD